MIKVRIGEFEGVVLTMISVLQEEAYGAKIAEEIEERLKRTVSLSAVHITLYRLEDKGFIKSSFAGASAERGGRRKRIYRITARGLAAFKVKKDTEHALWKLIPSLKISGI